MPLIPSRSVSCNTQFGKYGQWHGANFQVVHHFTQQCHVLSLAGLGPTKDDLVTCLRDLSLLSFSNVESRHSLGPTYVCGREGTITNGVGGPHTFFPCVLMCRPSHILRANHSRTAVDIHRAILWRTLYKLQWPVHIPEVSMAVSQLSNHVDTHLNPALTQV